jgi:hypothetical protein
MTLATKHTAPWTDCPRCPNCKHAEGIPRERADWNHRAGGADNLACPACGWGWVGTAEEVAQAKRAQDAWEAHLALDGVR